MPWACTRTAPRYWGGLQPRSDIDLLVVSSRKTSSVERIRLVTGLLQVSGAGVPGEGSRPLELTIVAQSDIRPWHYPPRLEFQYGEWWRKEFEKGEIAPWKTPSPDLTVLLKMARNSCRTIFGPPPTAVMDLIPQADVLRGMIEGIPSLLSDLDWDTRNVILTLARIWTTAVTGEIRSKAAAAEWVLARLPQRHRTVLDRAREVYLGLQDDRWEDLRPLVRPYVEHVIGQLERLGTTEKKPSALHIYTPWRLLDGEY